MRPSFPRWVHQQARSTWQRASNATRLKIDLLLLGVILAGLFLPPVITVLAAAIALAYFYRRYLRSLKNVSREGDSRIHTYIGDSLADESLRWAVTTWSRRYRP
ncbi:hypothetical protein [Mycolicibacterium sp.]|uniref:hypothetical protein n=1 Tax=Mycolicibacterium sp. TaxID=2320850 RepID=UPI0037C8E6FE